MKMRTVFTVVIPLAKTGLVVAAVVLVAAPQGLSSVGVGLICGGEGAASGSGACFAAGTLVQTEEGPRPIEDVEIGLLMVKQGGTNYTALSASSGTAAIYGFDPKDYVWPSEIVALLEKRMNEIGAIRVMQGVPLTSA